MGWFTDLSLRTQLLIAFGTVLLITAGGSVFGIFRLTSTIEGFGVLSDTLVAAGRQADNLDVHFVTRHKVINDAFLFVDDPQRIQQAREEAAAQDAQVQAGLAQLTRGGALRPDEQALVETATRALADYLGASQAALARIDAGGDPFQTQQEAARLLTLRDRPVTAALRELSRRLNERAEVETTRLELEGARAVPIAILTLAASLLIGFAIAVLLARNIARRVLEVSRAATGLAGGDVGQTLTIRSDDEIGRMASSFREMITYQQRMAAVAQAVAAGDLTQRIEPKSERDVLGTSFARMVDNLRELTVHIREDMAQLTTSSREILSSTAEHASGATEQSAAITETTATIQEVKTSAEQVADQAQVVSDSAQRVSEVAQQGMNAVHNATDGMLDIRERVQAVAENILALSEQSQQIGEIITAVSDLADQSNLLALNAAIEASRAGEQGKGFSVVATEIRTLAEQSKAATVQVRAILQDIQRATNAAVMAMEQGSKGVEAGMDTIEEAGRTMEELASVVEPAAQAAVQISVAVQQHAVGMEQIATAMNHISQATSQNLQAAKKNQQSAESLDGLAVRLNQLVAQYRV